MTFQKGYIPTLEHRDRIRQALKGRSIPKEIRENMSRACKGRVISIACRLKLSSAFKGAKTHLWRGGITKKSTKIRNSIHYRLWREAIFARDHWSCQNCGRQGYLHAHHIKSFASYPELRFAIDNGITLCKECHAKVHVELNFFKAKG